MELLKLYGISWLLLLGVVSTLYLLGSLGSTEILIVGFAASILNGAGLLVVYPVLLHGEIKEQQ